MEHIYRTYEHTYRMCEHTYRMCEHKYRMCEGTHQMCEGQAMLQAQELACWDRAGYKLQRPYTQEDLIQVLVVATSAKRLSERSAPRNPWPGRCKCRPLVLRVMCARFMAACSTTHSLLGSVLSHKEMHSAQTEQSRHPPGRAHPLIATPPGQSAGTVPALCLSELLSL